MKKILPKTLATLFIVLAGVSLAYAAAQTETRLGPDLTPEVVWSGKNQVTNLKSSASTATGNATFLYMIEKQNMSVGMANWNNRILTIRLYEKDFLGSNDLVKVYTWDFLGRYPNDVQIDTRMPGNIESKGDEQAELFVEIDVTKNSEDRGTTGSFFKYYYGIN